MSFVSMSYSYNYYIRSTANGKSLIYQQAPPSILKMIGTKFNINKSKKALFWKTLISVFESCGLVVSKLLTMRS